MISTSERVFAAGERRKCWAIEYHLIWLYPYRIGQAARQRILSPYPVIFEVRHERDEQDGTSRPAKTDR